MLLPLSDTLDSPANKLLLEDVSNFSSLNLNLFPEYGNIKKRPEDDRISKLKKIENDIKELKLDIEKQKLNMYNGSIKIVVQDTEDLQESFETFTENFKVSSLEVLKNRNDLGKPKQMLSENFNKTITSGENKIATIIQV